MVVMVLSKVSSRFSREGFRRPSDREDIVYQDRAQLGLGNEPPLALAPAVAQGLGRFSQGRTLLGLEEPEHLHPVKQVAVSMALLQLLQLFGVFLDHPWVV